MLACTRTLPTNARTASNLGSSTKGLSTKGLSSRHAVRALSRKRLSPRSQAVESERQIFQLYPTRAHTCILDVRDAREVCSLAKSPEERKACYAVFGLDAERVEKYYSTIVLLEESLEKVESEPEDKTPLTVKVFTMAVNVAAAIVSFIIAVFAVLSTMVANTWPAVPEAPAESALERNGADRSRM